MTDNKNVHVFVQDIAYSLASYRACSGFAPKATDTSLCVVMLPLTYTDMHLLH